MYIKTMAMERIRKVYKIILVIMVAAAGASYGYYQQQQQAFDAEQEALKKIWADHAKKVEAMDKAPNNE